MKIQLMSFIEKLEVQSILLLLWSTNQNFHSECLHVNTKHKFATHLCFIQDYLQMMQATEKECLSHILKIDH